MTKSILFTVAVLALLFNIIEASKPPEETRVPMPGGFVEISPNNTALLTAMHLIEDDLNKNIEDGQVYVVKRLLWAASQVVQGFIYLVDFQFYQTNCRKSEPYNIHNCVPNTKYRLCNAKIYYYPQTNGNTNVVTYQLMSSYCTNLLDSYLY